MESSWIALALLHYVVDVHGIISVHQPTLPPVGIFLLLAMLPGSGRVTSGQRLPSRDEEHYLYQLRHSEVFYDTRRLPDGREMKIFLPRNDTQRYSRPCLLRECRLARTRGFPSQTMVYFP